MSGHPGISWSIVLHVRPAGPVDVGAASERVAAAWPADDSAGPRPAVEAIPADVPSAVLAAANTPYVGDGPLVRIAVAPRPPVSYTHLTLPTTERV